MTYTIRHRNGSLLTTLADQEVNGNYSVTFTGRGVNSYGEIQQDNMLWLMENFASQTSPTNPVPGQLWFNTSNSSLYVCDSVNTTGGIITANWLKLYLNNPIRSQNDSAEEGDLWYDPTDKQLKVYVHDDETGGHWEVVGPSLAENQRILNLQCDTTTETTTSIRPTLPQDTIPKTNTLVSFRATILGKSVLDADNWAGMWEIRGVLLYKVNEGTQTMKIVSSENSQVWLSEYAQKYGWAVSTDVDSTNNLQFVIYGYNNLQPGDHVEWTANVELILNDK